MADSAWSITSRLIAGPVLYAGLGWLVSRWVGHQALLMGIGALVGLGLAYVLVFTSLARERVGSGTGAGPAGNGSRRI